MSESNSKLERNYVYEDPQKRSNRLTRFLKLNMILMILLAVTEVYRYYLYAQVSVGVNITQETIEFAESILGIIALIILPFFILTIVIYCQWIYRMTNNALSFKPADFKTTPGWAVGWNFIPVASVFVPYIQIKKIYKILKNPANWQSEKSPNKMIWWWSTWLISTGLSRVSARIENNHPDNIEIIKLATGIDIASSILLAISCYLLISIISELLIEKRS